MKKKIICTVAAVLLVCVLAVFGAAWYMLDYALTPSADRKDTAARYEKMLTDNPTMRPWIDSLRHAGALRDTFITADGGERHHAIFVRNPRSAGRTAILVHGYKDSSVWMLPIARIYADMGYNILLPDLHAHGLSDGSDIQMGWKDREDVIRWISVAQTMFGAAADKRQIVLHGVSMGAATVMNVAGEELPPSVKCFVEDCGFTSVWDEFSHELANQFGLPEFPVLYAASALCKLRYGWTFSEASPVSQLAHRSRPMLFIHGSSDDYVPSAMVFPLYNANPKDKGRGGNNPRYNGIWITPGTAHARSHRDYPQEYAARVAGFVSEYVK